LAIVHNRSTHVLLALDKGAVRPARKDFDITPTEVSLLERAVPGEALVNCTDERLFLDIVASPTEHQLFDTRPAKQVERNRQWR